MTNTINSNVNIKSSENCNVNSTAAAAFSNNHSSSPNNGMPAGLESGEAVERAAASSTSSTEKGSPGTGLALTNGGGGSPVLPVAAAVNTESQSTPSMMVATMKKVRPKTASPTRHGPQQCQVCNKVFGNASALAKHKLTHSDERKYVCGMCSKAFKRQDHLNGHMLTHRNKKPFECKAEGCGKSYCDARSLRRHTENHHSALALSPTTPVNATLLANSSSTGPPTGLSLSPATASGDASSPHGATFVPFNVDGQSSMSSSSFSSSTSSSPSAPSSPVMVANSSSGSSSSTGNEGLSKQQIDLISQIMQQTKQANIVIASQKQQQQQQTSSSSLSQRPRTWNMQTQLQQTPNTTTSFLIGSQANPQQQQHHQQPEPANKLLSNILVENTLTGTTTAAAGGGGGAAANEGGGSSSSQPQQQQQLPVLLNNGASTHINLVKTEPKPVECNLCHRKFKNIPALNGHMRLHGGYFKKESDAKKCDKKEAPGPPLQTASIGVRALIEEKIISKRSKDLKGAFLVPAPPLSTRRSPDTESFVMTPKLTAALVAGLSSNGTGNATQILKQHQQQQQQITTQTIQIPFSTGVSCGSNGSPGSAPTTKSIILADNKDATLIELLKRGTKVAVKRTLSDASQQILLTTTTTTANNGQMLPTPGQRTLNAILQNAKAISAGETGTLLHGTLQCQLQQRPGGKKGFAFTSDHTSPLTLSIGGSTIENTPTDDFAEFEKDDPSGASAFFSENEMYGVNDTSMLLQAVDPIQLLNESGTDADESGPLNGYVVPHATKLNDDAMAFTTSTQLQAVLNSPLPDSLAEFSTLHSKEYVLYDSPTCATTHSTSGGSPLPSPLAYPTPPASHEAVAQSSPFLDESHHFTDANNPFFGGDDDNNGSFMESEPMKMVSGDLANGSHIQMFDKSKCTRPSIADDGVDGEAENRLQDLSFLDEPQSFLDDDNRHVSSALSAAFFSSTMTSAEEVKEALQEVLPNETTSPATDTEIDLYYLPMLPIQSHMMSNSDDPLLSSSPKDFGGGRPLNSDRPSSVKHEFSAFGAPSSKCHKVDTGTDFRPTDSLPSQTSTAPGASHSTVSPNTSTGLSSRQSALISSQRKRVYRREVVPKPYELFKSRLKGGCLEDSPNCYTPAPILNPVRNGTGIYCCLLRDRPNALDEVESVPHMRLPQINVGQKYQAEIPEYSPFDVLDEDDMQGTCMWSPEVITVEEQGAQAQRFVDLAKSSTMPMGSHSEEMALKALLDCHGEFQRAILNLLQAPSVQSSQQWTPAEMSMFINGLDKFQKDFHSIARMIPHKTTSDCVQLYYFWKKLSVHYKATHLLKDWSDMAERDLRAGKRPKYENTATKSFSCGSGSLGSGSNFTAAASNYSATSSSALGSGHPMAAVGAGSSKLTTTSSSSSPSLASSAAALTMSSAFSSASISGSSHHDVRPYICEMPDCSASFSSKAALHGHKKLHCMGRNFSLTSATTSNHINSAHNNNPPHPNHHQGAQNSSAHNHHHPHSSTHGARAGTATTMTMTTTTMAATSHNTPQQLLQLQHSNTTSQATTIGGAAGATTGSAARDDFPCKVCGKVFSKVKSRSAHMKSHRPQESDLSTN